VTRPLNYTTKIAAKRTAGSVDLLAQAGGVHEAGNSRHWRIAPIRAHRSVSP
jgi:hypothetical protein